MTNKDSNKLMPRKTKIIATKVFDEEGYSVRQIATILGIPSSSVQRYTTEIIEPEWDEMAQQIKRLIQVKEEEIASKALREIEAKIPEAKFFELVGLYKTIRELQQPRGIGVARQVSIELPSWAK